jgi:hypothetical protein
MTLPTLVIYTHGINQYMGSFLFTARKFPLVYPPIIFRRGGAKIPLGLRTDDFS